MSPRLLDPVDTQGRKARIPDVSDTAVLPVMRPRLPTADALLPYLREIDANRWYSNNGPLEIAFEQRLADAFGISPTRPVFMSSGTAALQIAIRSAALAGRRKCLMPAWTFVATAHAVVQAGLTPHFADIDLATWALSPEAVLARSDLSAFAAIVVVAPFGQAPDIAAWNRVQQITGVPVIIDAAASFDALCQTGAAAIAEVPIIVSLHATKALGIGEGGLVLTRDPTFERHLRRAKNFGFDGSRDALAIGTNAKLSEYHCAVGLAALDEWPAKRRLLLNAQAHYTDRLADGRTVSPPFPHTSLGDWASTTFNVLVGEGRDDACTSLLANGIETRQWWGSGCHRQTAFANMPRDPLPNTDDLARSVLGLPFWAEMSNKTIDHVCAYLRKAGP